MEILNSLVLVLLFMFSDLESRESRFSQNLFNTFTGRANCGDVLVTLGGEDVWARRIHVFFKYYYQSIFTEMLKVQTSLPIHLAP